MTHADSPHDPPDHAAGYDPGYADESPPAKPRRPRHLLMRMARWILAIPLLGWLLATIGLLIAQESMIYPRHVIPPAPERPILPRGAQAWWLQSPDRGGKTARPRVEGWFIPADQASPEHPAPLAIYCHGNGELIDHQSAIVDQYHRMGVSVLLPEYRGYGRSEGKPSQKGIGQDMRAWRRILGDRADVDADRIVYHGRSLGGAVVCDLARDHPPAAMILESTFYSMGRMAQRYFAPPFLLRHPYRTNQVVAKADWPILIMHGTQDPVIPVEHGRALRDAAPDELVTYFEWEAGHGDFPGPGNWQRFWGHVEAFLLERGILHRPFNPS